MAAFRSPTISRDPAMIFVDGSNLIPELGRTLGLNPSLPPAGCRASLAAVADLPESLAGFGGTFVSALRSSGCADALPAKIPAEFVGRALDHADRRGALVLE
jgi:hypothetical protein